MMQRWFDENPPSGQVVLHHADIGDTKAWGMPVNNRRVARWPGYPMSVWDRDDFQQPDTVLIDGRFRLACFLTVLLRTTRPVLVLWDDYSDRTIERVAQAVQSAQSAGARVFFMHGNRDFLLGESFAESAGLELLPDPEFLMVNHHVVLITHGDQLCTDDRAYQQFRIQSRSEQWQAKLLALPL